jgi:hypothetical protein
MVLREGSAEIKGQCLLFRGMIKDDQGELDAKQDWLNALAYARAGTFLRHNLESNIGKVCETLGLREEAASWYRAALNTCSRGNEFSGHPALTALLKLSGGQISAEDKAMFRSVSEKSWRVLQLLGTPDLNDLVGTVSKLAEGFQKSVEEIANLTMFLLDWLQEDR